MTTLCAPGSRNIAALRLRTCQFGLAKSWLEKSGQFYGVDNIYPEVSANLNLWTARLILAGEHPDLDEARGKVREVYAYESNKIRVPRWTLAEVLWTDAEAKLLRNRKTKALDVAVRGNELFVQAGVVPTAVLAPNFVRKFDQKYPKDIYVVPRNATKLGSFKKEADEVLEILRLDNALRC